MAVSTRRRPMTNVDANLEAASAPISLEPEAGGIEGRHAARMAELVRQGVPRQQAMEIAGREVIQAQSAEADARADARVQSGYRDPDQTAYNAETFAEGYGFDDNNQPAYLGPVDIGDIGLRNRATTVDRGYNFRDPRGAEVALNDLPHPGRPVVDAPRFALGMTAPGPQTLDGRPVRPARPLNTPEEIEAYDVRPDQGLSQRDKDMALRGMVPVVTPNGVSYMLAYQPTEAPTDEDIVSGGRGAVVAGRDGKLFRPPNDGYPIPGGPGRAGPRPDLEGKYEAQTMVGPDGNPVQVLAPGPDMRAKQAANLAQRQEAYKVKKASMDARLQKSRDLFAATAILAGGSQNINRGNRDIYNQAAGIEDKGKQAEFLSQFRQGSRGFQSNDPRIQVAQIQAEAQKSAAEAERVGRDSQNQWLETTKLAAEERMETIRTAAEQERQRFEGEQKKLEIEARSSEGNAAREEAAKVRTAELTQQRNQFEMTIKKMELQHAEQMSRLEAAGKDSEQRHLQTLETMRGDTASRTAGAAATVEGARITAGAATGEAEAKRDAAETQQRTALELGMQEKSPGLYDVMTGNPSTEDAIRELKRIAAGADRFQYLPGYGFGAWEAESMNDHLKRLQRQAELTGLESPLADPEYRRELIRQYGYSSGFLGGRGGYFGNFSQPMPEDLR